MECPAIARYITAACHFTVVVYQQKNILIIFHALSFAPTLPLFNSLLIPKRLVG
jgi:hypothetical protein